jgi:hypothetical protein
VCVCVTDPELVNARFGSDNCKCHRKWCLLYYGLHCAHFPALAEAANEIWGLESNGPELEALKGERYIILPTELSSHFKNSMAFENKM